MLEEVVPFSPGRIRINGIQARQIAEAPDKP
jgi:hypothetical protein